MNKIRFQRLACVFVVLLCVTLSSCNVTKNSLQVSSEVDFSEPKTVQITFNEHIYNTTVVFKNGKLELNFSDEKDLIGGAYVSIDSTNYKITYNDMVFEGEKTNLSNSFLPSVIYSFLNSFDGLITLDSYNKDLNCFYISLNTEGSFIVFESYEKDGKQNYSMEIK
ncbi:MAG: hypothetical protein ACI4VW_00840 [Acutalibacteraceae bacterium]